MDQITEIKQKINIVDFIGGYVSLKKAGKNYKGLCPFHSEKTPSFMVSPELQIFKCFGCNEAGDIYSFLQKIEGIDFSTALQQLADKAGVKLERAKIDPQSKTKKTLLELNHLAAEFYHFVLTKHKIGKNAHKYFKDKRKLTEETIKKFKLGYAPDSWNSLYTFLSKKGYKDKDILEAGLIIPKKSEASYIDRFKGRVMFPLTGIDGKVLGFTGRTIFDREPKYLNTNDTLIFHKQSFIYGLDKAKISIKKEGAIFVEGQMDVISAHQAGLSNVIASSGTSLATGQLKVLSRYTKDIIFCFDSDSAGSGAMIRAIDLAEKEDFNIRVAIIPQNYKDLDELVNADPKAAKNLFKDPIPVYDFFLISTLKKYNKNDPINKKKIVSELVPIYSKIKNLVILDHYIKKLSEEIDISIETLSSLIHGKSDIDEYIQKDELQGDSSILFKKSPQEYILTLLLKAPLDSAQTVLYKLGQKDFTDPALEKIFTNLKDYIIGRKRRFEIKYFNNKFSDSLKNLVQEMYMWDLGEITEDSALLENELDVIFTRIKRGTLKRELRDLGEKIKQAELEKDTKLIEELSERFKELSEKLI